MIGHTEKDAPALGIPNPDPNLSEDGKERAIALPKVFKSENIKDMPLKALNEEDYNMIFKVTIKDAGKVNLEVFYYGTLHHTSNLPVSYRPDKQNYQQYSRPVTNY